MANLIARRKFLEFLGKSSTLALLTPDTILHSCNSELNSDQGNIIQGIRPSAKDLLVLADGLTFDILLKWGDPISSKDYFGFNNDYVAYLPDATNGVNGGLLWVNHEYIDPKFVSGYTSNFSRTREQVDKEMYEVGGTLVRIRRNRQNKWEVVFNDPLNRRLTAKTKIAFHPNKVIAGTNHAIGTLANCAGGITPWQTILTCEENYDGFYGERNWETGERTGNSIFGWEKFYNYPPEHYGWVVEVNPLTGEARKLIALGRCAHECATVKELPDKRVVVYTGDDSNNECLYKFISAKPGSLAEGTLYVANLENNRWESLNFEEQPVLKKTFKSQEEVLIRLREASKLVGGSRLDRPEDIEIDPLTGNILVALTNNIPEGNYHGSILRLEEENNNYESLTFNYSTFLAGGEETGFACPDNMVFDLAGNLWFTSDIAGTSLNQGKYKAFKNNGLFLVLRQGPQAGAIIQIASAPVDAELTGPFFSPDGKTLFLCVQHPGENSPDVNNLTSTWPEGGANIPKSAVVTISGPLLEQIQRLPKNFKQKLTPA